MSRFWFWGPISVKIDLIFSVTTIAVTENFTVLEQSKAWKKVGLDFGFSFAFENEEMRRFQSDLKFSN